MKIERIDISNFRSPAALLPLLATPAGATRYPTSNEMSGIFILPAGLCAGVSVVFFIRAYLQADERERWTQAGIGVALSVGAIVLTTLALSDIGQSSGETLEAFLIAFGVGALAAAAINFADSRDARKNEKKQG